MGELNLVPGSSGNDSTKVKGGEAYFGGDGIDRLTGLRTTFNGMLEASFLIGGDGDDIYKVDRGAFAVISDFGSGYDRIDLDSFAVSNTYIADVDDDFLLVADSKSIALVYDPSQFEEVRFGKQNYDPDELIDIANSRGAHLGSTNFESLVDSGYLMPSLFGLDLSSQGIKELVQAAENNSDIVF